MTAGVSIVELTVSFPTLTFVFHSYCNARYLRVFYFCKLIAGGGGEGREIKEA